MTASSPLRERIARDLVEARERTLALLAALDDAALCQQHSPLMSPMVWDLAHIGNYEDLWLLRALGHDGLGAQWDDIYDAFRHARKERSRLELMGPDAARAYVAAVRQQALEALSTVDLLDGEPVVRDGFVYDMVVQHEHQHDETLLATLQLMSGEGYRPVRAPARQSTTTELPVEVLVAGGAFVMGTSDDTRAYDNEKPAHTVNVAGFYIDTAPVNNQRYIEFIDDNGYGDPRWWSDMGWKWRQEAALEHPQFWERHGDGWRHTCFGWVEALPLNQPVQHVCWYEADAYARWAGKRLPTESEWEKAASWDPSTGRKRRYPWGDEAPTAARANLDSGQFGPDEIGSHPSGASAYGCHQMLGDVWEWTSSDFAAYPGFVPFPYREYSEVFWGDEYKVLRGGAWATSPAAMRNTFRNWDYPIRRQIFAGFRCARDE
jgi:iron(II)-dependent oxidoreductase